MDVADYRGGAPIPPDESARLHDLHSLSILDTAPEETFDRITRMASALLDMPIALVSLIDEDRQWFKSRVGLAPHETPRDMAFCGYAILGDDIFTVDDATADERFADNPLVQADPNIRFYAGAPLKTRSGSKLGTLCVIDRKPRNLSDDQLSILQDLADMVGRELELRRLASLDPLTGALNRSALVAQSRRELTKACRTHRPVAFALIDLDGFKQVNDGLGHAVGDRVLAAAAKICSDQVRAEDWFGRLGGDEFGVVLPDASQNDALLVAERIRAALDGGTLSDEPHTTMPTASIGVTCAGPEETDTDSAWSRADVAMYRSKVTHNAVTWLGPTG